MHILLLHLSDIHIRHANEKILEKADKLVAVLNAMPQPFELCVVVLSGDIAFSGKSHEYESIEPFLARISSLLADAPSIASHRFVIVPGNHDCNFDADNDMRRLIMKSVAGEPNRSFDSTVIDTCTSIQEEFFAFMANVERRKPETGLSRQRYTREFPLSNGATIRFHCYNTAWVSRKEEKPSELSFPPQPPIPRSKKPDDISVTVFHHPLRWLHPDNARPFEKHVDSTSDFVLVGHEHVIGQFHKSRPTGQSNEYYEAGALNPGTTPLSSEFSVIVLDLHERQHSSVAYEWINGQYERKGHTLPRNFALSPGRYTGFKFTAKFHDELIDAGARFTHPAKAQLTIDDIYVPCDIRELKSKPERRGRVETIPSKVFAKDLPSRRRVAVYGDDCSGKTTLARTWARTLLDQNISPILLSVSLFGSPDHDEVMAVLNKQCTAQYGPGKSEEFLQLHASQRAIVIDDFHRCRWPVPKRQQLLDVLDVLFGTIVIFGNELMKLSDITYDKEGNNPLLPFHKFEILPFGHALRHTIAERWLRIGSGSTEEDPDFIRRVNGTTRAFNSLIGKDLAPSYPIFLLILLQHLEAVSTTSEGLSFGSYGYFYEALIRSMLANLEQIGVDLDTGYKYLAELARSMYRQGVRALSFDALERHHETYCAEYRLSLPFQQLIDRLVSSGILQCSAEQYEFKYSYLYYYSVARSLRDDVQQLGTQMAELVKTIYTDESTGIVMFLVYLSRDERIIASVLNKARSLYADTKPCDLHGDVSFLRELGQGAARLKLPPSSARDNHISLAHESDRRSVSKRSSTSISVAELSEFTPFDEEVVDDGEALDGKASELAKATDDILQLNVAFKTIQILGQIIKNFPGSTKGDMKFEIARECYSLGLRAMQRILRLIFENQDWIKLGLEKWLRARQVNPTEVGGKASGMIWLTCEALVLTFIIKTAQSVGLPKLSRTYDEIVAKDSSVSVGLIDLAVRLEHFPGFPESEVVGLRKAVHGEPFPKSILSRLVYRHFYLHETSYKLKQRVCKSLDITVPNRMSFKALKAGSR